MELKPGDQVRIDHPVIHEEEGTIKSISGDRITVDLTGEDGTIKIRELTVGKDHVKKI